MATFIANLLKSDEKGQPVNKALVDQMVVELDRKISAQMDEILHAPKLQELESSWRGLKLMVDRKSTRLNSSHVRISYAVFCLKKKKKKRTKKDTQHGV